jgi:phosphatidylethanolamine-binding protein (PEBP) family uncharacterized protein
MQDKRAPSSTVFVPRRFASRVLEEKVGHRQPKGSTVNTKPLTLSQLALLFVAAAAPLGAACSSDSSGGGGTTTAGAPGAAGSPGAAGAAHAAGASGSHAGASGSHAGASGSHAGASGGHAGASGSHAGGGGASSTGGAGGAGGAVGTAGTGGGSSSGAFAVTSTDFMDMAKFGGMFTCNGMSLGKGINPELKWTGAPAGAMSFVITFIDTTLGANNAMGQHWAMYDIPATVTELPQGAAIKTPTGTLATSKQATPLNAGFLAPCAQSDTSKTTDDQYEFTVYALSTASLTTSDTSVKGVLTALGVLPSGTLAASVLGHATIHGHSGYNGM